MNSTGFYMLPSYFDGVALNHFEIIEQLLAGIVLILGLWFLSWTYFKFTKDVMK